MERKWKIYRLTCYPERLSSWSPITCVKPVRRSQARGVFLLCTSCLMLREPEYGVQDSITNQCVRIPAFICDAFVNFSVHLAASYTQEESVKSKESMFSSARYSWFDAGSSSGILRLKRRYRIDTRCIGSASEHVKAHLGRRVYAVVASTRLPGFIGPSSLQQPSGVVSIIHEHNLSLAIIPLDAGLS
ncbi:hypothetical protein BDQ17DRAFT_519055 [Cyathus striatus]|nr:hypothetical protein BDQ17DRAFT_519055 [Cyathus striatus]